MKIAFVNQPWNRVQIPVTSGSIAIWTYEVARRLAPAFEVLVYGRRIAGEQVAERDGEVEYRRIPIAQDVFVQRVARRFSVPGLNWSLRFDRAPYFLGYATRIASDLGRRRCDVVHIHNYSQFAPVIRRLNPDARIVLHMHCEWLTQIDKKRIAGRMRSVDRVIGCSEYLTETIRCAFPELRDKCYTVRNGVNLQHFTPGTAPRNRGNGGKRTILFVGRISPEKGVHVLVDAFARVLRERPETRLELVGPLSPAPSEFVVDPSDDPLVRELAPLYRPEFAERLRKNMPAAVSDKATFVGPVPYLELLDRYRAADVFVFPSVWNEPFGLPVVEAMACGVPVVATRSGGIPEIVRDGETGLLVERGNPEELASALLRVLSSEGQGVGMGEAGSRRARELFGWERVAAGLGSVYASVETQTGAGRGGR